MAHEGQELAAPNGVRLSLVSIEDDLLEMEARYPGDGQLPPEHLHPRQDEHFEVLEGSIKAIVDGEERRYEAGDAFDVPAGTPHQMAAESEARFRWEVRPALRTAEFFETLYTGAAGPDFLDEFKEEFRLTADQG
jgi:mannose-6-phosphate isomerase-like protein (cupin superfamily)